MPSTIGGLRRLVDQGRELRREMMAGTPAATVVAIAAGARMRLSGRICLTGPGSGSTDLRCIP